LFLNSISSCFHDTGP